MSDSPIVKYNRLVNNQIFSLSSSPFPAVDSGHNNSRARWSGHYSGDKPFVHMHQGQTLTAHLSDSQIPSDFYGAGRRLQTLSI